MRVVLLDIEGTTTPISFVHETLFAFARAHLDSYLARHWTAREVQDAVRRLADEHSADRYHAPAWRPGTEEELRDSAAAYAHWLMARDRKSPGLKALQGLIWEEGYQAGELHGLVWDDVPAALKRWQAAGRRVAIYSSGSELAQRRLFGSTNHGDLTPFIAAFFDTTVGAKVEAASYVRIAAALDCRSGEITFVSDVTAELRAASEAGCQTVLSTRPGNPPQPEAAAFRAIQSFDEL
jgi:enolase-phosphatase E1